MNYTGLKNVESHLRGLTRLIFLPLLFHPIKHYLCSFGYYHFTTLVLPRNLYLRKDRNYHNISYNIEKWNELSNFHWTSLMKIRIIYVEFFLYFEHHRTWYHHRSFDFIISDPIFNNKQTIDLERNSSSEFYQKIFVNHRSVYNFWTNYSTRKVPRILSRLPLEQIPLERFDNWRRETASTDVIGHRVKVS